MKAYFYIFLLAFLINRPLVSQELDIKTLSETIKSQSVAQSKKMDTAILVLDQFDSFNDFTTQFQQSEFQKDSKLLQKIELVYQGKQNQFPELIKNSEELLERKDCNLQDSIFSYYTSAYFLNFGNYFTYALERYNSLLELYEKYNLLDKKQHLLHDIGLVYYHQKRYDKTIRCYKKALKVNHPTADFLFPYQISNNLALAYKKQQRYDSALSYFKKVETFISQELADSLKGSREDFFLGLVRGNQGSIYAKLGDYDKAITLLLEDLEISLRTEHYLSACNARISLAEIFLESDQLDESIKYLDSAFSCAKKHNYREQRNSCLWLLAQYHQRKGNYKQSSEFYSKHIVLNDSINSELLKQKTTDFKLEMAILDQKNEISLLKMESKKDQAELDSRRQQLYFTIGFSLLLVLILFILLFNYKNKTKLNRVLRDKNQEINKRGLQLESALYEKSLMLKEMHHRVKNNLQLVQSLLRLQSAEINNSKVSIAFEESINRLTSMSLIHQNLYQQEKLKNIEFKSYLESLLEQLKISFKNSEKQIKLELNAEELNISIDNSIPVGLIVNELISNSFQHAFRNKSSGIIKVSIKKNESQVSLYVSDNGSGLNQDFSLENKSFGTTLIKMLVEQVQGEITFYNENGAHFNITFEDQLT